MRLLCKIGMHRYRPVKVFHTDIEVTGIDGERREFYVSNFEGLQCQCGTRKLKKLVGYRRHSPSVGERQEAYDWLNEQENRPKARILKLAKR